jgi:hypothetical protein
VDDTLGRTFLEKAGLDRGTGLELEEIGKAQPERSAKTYAQRITTRERESAKAGTTVERRKIHERGGDRNRLRKIPADRKECNRAIKARSAAIHGRPPIADP